MKTITLILVLSIYFLNLKAQISDTTQYKQCRVLYEQGKKHEALQCYRNYENNNFIYYKIALIYKDFGDNKQMVRYANKLISKKNRSAQTCKDYISLFEDDSVNYYTSIKKVLQYYPYNKELLITKVNYHLKYQQLDDAELILTKLIESSEGESNNSYYYARGVIYDQQSLIDKAVEDYKKAIEISPDYFNAVYNLAVLYYNQASEMYNEANEYKDDNLYKSKKEAADKTLEKSLPYFEKAVSLKPDDKQLSAVVEQIYKRLK